MKLLFLLFVSLFSLGFYAQDTICMYNGDMLYGKVEEVGTDLISYRKASNPEGPTYGIFKNDVSSIKYANGSVDDFSNVQAPLADEPMDVQEPMEREEPMFDKRDVWLVVRVVVDVLSFIIFNSSVVNGPTFGHNDHASAPKGHYGRR